MAHPIIKKYISMSRDDFFDEVSPEDIKENERWFFMNCAVIERHEIRKVKMALALEKERDQ